MKRDNIVKVFGVIHESSFAISQANIDARYFLREQVAIQIARTLLKESLITFDESETNGIATIKGEVSVKETMGYLINKTIDKINKEVIK